MMEAGKSYGTRAILGGALLKQDKPGFPAGKLRCDLLNASSHAALRLSENYYENEAAKARSGQ